MDHSINPAPAAHHLIGGVDDGIYFLFGNASLHQNELCVVDFYRHHFCNTPRF
jgi:hypothetical protein